MENKDFRNMTEQEFAALEAELGQKISEIAKEADEALNATIIKLNNLLTPYGIRAQFALQLLEDHKE